MRLIDADALKKHLMEMEIFMPYGGDGSVMAVPEISIDHAPTIDAEPVRHGRWEFYEDWGYGMSRVDPPEPFDAGWKCSNCGIDLGDYLTDCLGVNVYVDEEDKMPKIKSCPHCGAKMDAKEA